MGHILKLSKARLNDTHSDKDERLFKESSAATPTVITKTGTICNDTSHNILSPFASNDNIGEAHRTNVKDIFPEAFISQNSSETNNKSHINFNHKLEDRFNDKVLVKSVY